MAPLQRRAWLALGIAVAMLAAWLGIMFVKGFDSWDTDAQARHIIEGIWVGGGLLYLLIMRVTILGRRKSEVAVDERDRAIMQRATYAQLLAVLLSVVAWSIVVTEVYHDQGAIPVVFANMIAMFSLVAMLVGQAAGILVGYWRA